MTNWIDNQKNLMLFAGRAHPELAEQVSKELGIQITPQTARDFANGETFVRFEESVRGSDAFVLQSHPFPLNQWVMEQLIMIDALKRGSAKRITAILPFYPYARQDKKHRGREPISARLIADLLKTAGADRIITVDLHTDQIQASSTARSTTCTPRASSPSTSAAGTASRTSRWSPPPTPVVCAWPRSGPTPSGAPPRWRSSTRPATRWCRTSQVQPRGR